MTGPNQSADHPLARYDLQEAFQGIAEVLAHLTIAFIKNGQFTAAEMIMHMQQLQFRQVQQGNSADIDARRLAASYVMEAAKMASEMQQLESFSSGPVRRQ